MSNASKIMNFYAEMVPVIAKLREMKSNYIHDLMDRAHQVAMDKAWWNNGQGYFDLAAGVASGVIGIGSGFMPENIGKILDGVGKAVPFLGNVGKTRMESEKMPLQLDETLITQTTLPGQTEKQRTLGELNREWHDTAERIVQAEHEGKRKAASERG